MRDHFLASLSFHWLLCKCIDTPSIRLCRLTYGIYIMAQHAQQQFFVSSHKCAWLHGWCARCIGYYSEVKERSWADVVQPIQMLHLLIGNGSTGVDGVWTIGRREDYFEECACSGEQNQFSVLDFQRGLTFTHQLIWLINELCLTGGWVFHSVHPCLIESIRFKIFNPSPASPWSLVLL